LTGFNTITYNLAVTYFFGPLCIIPFFVVIAILSITTEVCFMNEAYAEPVLIQCFIDAVLIFGWCTTPSKYHSWQIVGTVASATDIYPVCGQAASRKAASLPLIRFSVLQCYDFFGI